MSRSNPQQELLPTPKQKAKTENNVIETHNTAEFEAAIARQERGEIAIHSLEVGRQNGWWKFYVTENKQKKETL